MSRLIAILLCLIGMGNAMAGSTPVGEVNVKKPHVTALVLGGEKDAFWGPFSHIMQAAAANLGVILTVEYTDRNPVILPIKGRGIIDKSVKPDYLVLVNEQDYVPTLIRDADSKGISTVLVNGPLPEERYLEFKSGDEPLKHWIGGLLPDEEQSGYLVAQHLVENARRLGLADKNNKIKIAGLNGALRSYTSDLREKGLHRYVTEQDDVALARVVNAHWKKTHAEDSSNLLFKVYPDISLIWSASDLMALGAADAAVSNKRKPGEDFLTCGVDWIGEISEQIVNGNIACSVGGHIFDGAWLMVLLLDHFNDESKEFLDYKTQFSVIDENNVEVLNKLLEPKLWKSLDYRKFSKSYGNKHPDNFGVHLLMNELQSE